ncbi:MAG: HAD superfamily hydrolase (TIGR01549 family) [Paraglaciecola sp.]|jgi:HAD superfamily hydrolase (TIGR01549 family)
MNMTHRIATIKGFIFDLDGTLLTSTLNFRLLREMLNCPLGSDILSFISTLTKEQQVNASQLIYQHEIQDAQSARWIEGAEQLVELLVNKQLPLAIVTRNCRAAAQLKIQRNQLNISTILTREDAPAKPDPSALLRIAKQWQLDPQDLAYVGDYEYDVQAANRSGMMSCLYTAQHMPVPAYAHQADWVFSHFSQFCAAIDD